MKATTKRTWRIKEIAFPFDHKKSPIVWNRNRYHSDKETCSKHFTEFVIIQVESVLLFWLCTKKKLCDERFVENKNEHKKLDLISSMKADIPTLNWSDTILIYYFTHTIHSKRRRLYWCKTRLLQNFKCHSTEWNTII